MLCDETYTLAAGEAGAVAPARLARVAQRQQREGDGVVDVAGSHTMLDVPVSDADVERWAAALSAVAPPTAAALAPSAGDDGRWPQPSPPLARTSDGPFGEADRHTVTHFRSGFVSAATALAQMPSAKQRHKGPVHPLAPLPPFDPTAVTNLPMTKVLKMRREWLPYRQRFAIYQQRMPFLDAVLNHAVVALVGGPGSGRTLQTPLILAETEAFKRRRIIVVTANAVAARLTVHRLREERGEAAPVSGAAEKATTTTATTVSRSVAAVLPGCASWESATPGTSVLVTTAEVLLRQLLCDPTLVDVGCVIFDDVHIRNEYTELCLAALRDALVQSLLHDQKAATTGSAAIVTANGDATSASMDGPEKTSGRLRVVLNCPDEAAATPLLEYFANGLSTATSGQQPALTLRTTLFSLTRPEARLAHYAPAVVLHVDETVQWLSRCEREGSRVCKDPDAELAAYADHVDVVARVFAATDADFAQPETLREFWCEMMLQAIRHYDAADRAAAQATAGAALPPRVGDTSDSAATAAAPTVVIVVVVPDVHSALTVAQELRRKLPAGGAEGAVATANEDEKTTSCEAGFVLTTLLEAETDLTNFLHVAQRNWGGTGRERQVVLTTPELAQTVLPGSLEVGLVIDCARSGYRSCRQSTMTDAYGIEYSTIQALRQRRAIGKVQLVGNSLQHQPTCMVLQLIPKSVLHGAAHRRYSADAAQHIIFHLPFERYVQLYSVLLAHEEASATSDSATQDGATVENSSSTMVTATGAPLSSRIAQVVANRFIGVPASTSNRYEPLRRIFAAIEMYLLAARHIAHVPLTMNHTTNNNNSSATSVLRLQPLGVLTLCLPYPCVVSRLLVLSTLCHCSLVATALAAIWLTGDPFAVPLAERTTEVGQPNDEDAGADTDDERAALLNVARAFFARDTNSDPVAAFNVYKMWLSVYSESNTSDRVSEIAAQQQQSSPPEMSNEEADFLNECKVSRTRLLAIAARHVSLLREMQRLGLWSPEQSSSHTDDDVAFRAEVRRRVCGLAEDVMLSGPVQLCLTGALYPHCVRLDDKAADGAALLLDVAPVNEGSNNSSSSNITSATGGGTGVAQGESGAVSQRASHPWLRRLGVLADSCVVMSHAGSGPSAMKVAGQPFLYVGKAAAGETEVAVVVHTTPMHHAAALVFCGEVQERLKPVPLRCRGWTSMLTSAWRQTRQARSLPPPAQLPPVTVPLQPYDTIRSRHVVVQADRRLQYSMRATSARWLWQLRAHIERHLAALTNVSGTAWAAAESAAEIANAWSWWMRRQTQGAAWLREERQVQRHNSEGNASSENAKAGPQLRGYYVFSTTPGTPVPLAPPDTTDAVTNGDDDKEDEGDSAQKPAVYTGKLPSPDVDHIFRMCVKSVAAKRTREAEAQLLRDNPDIFAFLDPENEFHEYYLFLLRQAAPDMEVLGDNLDELIEYLQKLETTLRAELGIAATSEVTGKDTKTQDTNDSHAPHAVDSATNDAVMVDEVVMSPMGGEEAGYYGEQSTGGLQLETAAVSLKRRAAPMRTSSEEVVVPFAKRARYDALQHDPTAVTPPPPPIQEQQTQQQQPSLLPPNVALPLMPQSVLASDPTAAATQSGRNARGTNKPAAGSGLQGIGNFTFATPSTTATATPAATTFVTPSSASAAGREPTLMEKLMAMQSASGGATTTSSGNEPSAAFITPPPTTTTTTPMMTDPTALQNNTGTSNGNAPIVDAGDVGFVEAETTLPAPPTTAELMALLANTTTAPLMMPTMAPLLPPNPLAKPPPPLPRFALDARTPSVLVYPLPELRYGNLGLILARALSQTMTLRVGPTRILGRVARIEVPNRNVEARALSLKSFTCLGQKVFILRNDRIIDNPNAHRAAQQAQQQQQQQEVLPPWPHYKQMPLGGEEGSMMDGANVEHGDEKEGKYEKPVSAADMTTTTTIVAGPVLHETGDDAARAAGRDTAPTKASQPVLQIGVFSDSDEEDDDDEEEEDEDEDKSSRSSSSSSSSTTTDKQEEEGVAPEAQEE